nr:restriction endonuclease [Bacteroidia bacterium]
ALHLQRKLEELAIAQEKAGGKYIRPIVLFQAQPRTGEEKITYEKLKATLIKLKIPEAQIKIKTAEIDELKGINLLDRNCPVRFIITINALKEGWDCPFAYVLASLADKSSAVDVEQILGRVLRQPYVMKHAKPLLNVSYVLTASAKFTETLGSIVKGLQSSGFSERDYRNHDTMTEEAKEKAADQQLDMLLNPNSQPATTATTDEIDTERITYDPTAPITTAQPTDATTTSGQDATTEASAPPTPPIVTEIEKMAEQENAKMEEQVRQQAENPYDDTLFTEMPEKVTKYQMVPAARSVAEALRLPQFMHEIPGSLFTDNDAVKAALNPEYLLQDFRLSDEDTRIDFDQIVGEMFKVDLELRDAATDDYTPRQTLLTKEAQGSIAEYILSKPHDAQVKDLSGQICALMGSMFPIADQEIKEFVGRILKKLDANQIRDMIVHRSSYTARIKAKIKEHSDRYAEKRFYDWLGVDRITTQPNWKFQRFIVPAKLGPALSKSLYDREAEMSEFEHRLISQIVSLDNIAYWHRNFVKGNGFAINGFKSNHYPDFILITKTGKVILVETKGADRDNSDSKAKCKLGKTWAAKAGPGFYYFMVFEKNPIEDAYSLEQAKALIAGL